MDSAPTQSGGLNGSLPRLDAGTEAGENILLDDVLLEGLWREAEASRFALERGELANALCRAAEKCHYNLPPDERVTRSQAENFWRGLRLRELAMAHACAAGHEEAWQIFLAEYREPLTRAAIAITGSSGIGRDLADALYAELYGLREHDGIRSSPLLSYTGRGSLLGWLRATLAQKHVDHHRRTHRETPLDDRDFASNQTTPVPPAGTLAALNNAVATCLRELGAEERFMLSAWFLDRRTLQQIARLLRVHEATASRRIKRLTESLHKALLRNLQSAGLSRRAAEEAMGADPRDLTLNLRSLLQNSQSGTFQEQDSSGPAAEKT